MPCRVSRFAGEAPSLPESADFNTRSVKVPAALASAITLLEEELAASSAFADAWSTAKESYSSHFLKELSEKEKNKIDEVLPKHLPEALKSHPEYLAIAVIVCTQGPSTFFDEFNGAVKELFSQGDWDAFPFKSLFALLDSALQLLPCRPFRQMEKRVFRALSDEHSFTVGDTFKLGQFTPFTVRRGVALGKPSVSKIL